MTDMQRYLAEEVAEDHADGIITRREAVRRLGLLGVTGAAATGLLAAFTAGEAAAAPSETVADQERGRTARETTWAPVARLPAPAFRILERRADVGRERAGLQVGGGRWMPRRSASRAAGSR